jgi:phenylalanyl-tRNA synthetase alpha chain
MDIKKTSDSFKSNLNKIKDIDSLENLRIEYLGRKGFINSLIDKLKTASADDKKEFGSAINKLKQEIEKSLNIKKNEVLQKNEDDEAIDPTLPGIKYPKGSLHPTTLSINELIKIFQKIGFSPASYPEVEWEYFAFEALNMPVDHPARDDFETFFIDAKPDGKYGKVILTPHTSSGQIREMKRLKNPPIRMINIAKCYRPNWDTTHTPMFHQFEGMCVDKDISIINLKGTIDYFVGEFFGKKRKTRLRPFHFQFTEPSFEVDITCGVCNGIGYLTGGETERAPDTRAVHLLDDEHWRERKSRQVPLNKSRTKCKVCKSGWLELGGAGMIHPNVLKEGGIDPDQYSGWAFGFGIERVYMMKEGLKLDDIRILYSGQVEFLNQF